MSRRSIFIVALLLALTASAQAKHAEDEETNVVMFVCVIDLSKRPLGLYVEAISSNTTRHTIPLIRTGAPCAQALHEFLTAGFEIVNSLTATDHFVLIRKDKLGSSH